MWYSVQWRENPRRKVMEGRFGACSTSSLLYNKKFNYKNKEEAKPWRSSGGLQGKHGQIEFRKKCAICATDRAQVPTSSPISTYAPTTTWTCNNLNHNHNHDYNSKLLKSIAAAKKTSARQKRRHKPQLTYSLTLSTHALTHSRTHALKKQHQHINYSRKSVTEGPCTAWLPKAGEESIISRRLCSCLSKTFCVFCCCFGTWILFLMACLFFLVLFYVFCFCF